MKRILIIDDDEEFCLELRDFLEHRGYEVVYATRGSDAIDLDRSFGANAAFIDLNLPDSDGIQIAWQLTMAREDLMIFAISADSRRLIEGLKGRSCIAGFLSKPLRPVELARLLNEPVIPVVPPNQN
jgi:two-component system response regulator HydG